MRIDPWKALVSFEVGFALGTFVILVFCVHLIHHDLEDLVQTMQVLNVQLNHGITNHVELPYGFGVNATNYAPYVWRADK